MASERNIDGRGGRRKARGKTITKALFVERIRQVTGLPRSESAALLESLLDAMKDVLADGENIKISGFGTFVVRAKAARRGRNPKTNLPITLPRRRVLTFKPSQVFRAALKEG